MFWDGTGAGRRRRRGAAAAFSLPELMIALAILGLGLLIIAAALPVGLTYTSETAAKATGEAAVDYVLDTIQSSALLWVANDAANNPAKNSTLFRPFDGTLINAGYEPLIKVRPVVTYNLDTTPGQPQPGIGQPANEYPDEVEEVIGEWLRPQGFVDALEFDQNQYLSQNPLITSVLRVYPPIAPDVRRFPIPSLQASAMYSARLRTGVPESTKAGDRRFGWTAFYRRASYGPGSDPLLYEVIAVVTRRPTERHRYARQDWTAQFNAITNGVPVTPASAASVGNGGPDRLAPVPWLVTMQSLPALPPPAPTFVDYTFTNNPDRLIDPNYREPATLSFTATPAVAALLPVGSLIIPAVNDEAPANRGGAPLAGFAPRATRVLPIYKVVKRPDATTILVQNEGIYPWVDPNAGAGAAAAALWPCWIIPPAYRELDANGQPVFENTTPTVSVSRRMMRFREVGL